MADHVDNERENFDDEERDHLESIVQAFLHYRVSSTKQIQAYGHVLDKFGGEELPSKQEKMETWAHCANVNASLIDKMVEDVDFFVNKATGVDDVTQVKSTPSQENMSKVRSTIRQLMRDWSAEGQEEREKSYQPIMDALNRLVPTRRHDGSRASILIPGAGLARLVLEVAAKGYATEGNEVSYFMMIASNFILNRDLPKESVSLHPFIHETQNIVNWRDAMREVRVPDVRPLDLVQAGNPFSMSAGDFVEVFGNERNDKFDCVVTAFFLDTAKNIFDYVTIISKITEDGGVWINNGPLLYHFGNEGVQLAWDEVRQIILSKGFAIEEEKIIDGCSYTSNRLSLCPTYYRCIYFVARKGKL